MTKEEIDMAALEAFPVHMMYGGGQPAYDDNEKERRAFIYGFNFRQWLEDATMTHPDIPLRIKYRMFFNQKNQKPFGV
jgi:hypothetical protein